MKMRPKAEDKKKGARRGKRKRITSKRKIGRKRIYSKAKRARATKSREEGQTHEYFEEKRNLEDLWKTAFPVGIEEAFEEGGILHGKKKLFVFVHPEPQFIHYRDVVKIVNIPTVVALESPFPPSDKLVLTSVTSASEKIMKMEWVPYFPLEKRDREIDRMNFQIVCLVCTQRRAALRHLKEDRVMKFQYCLPYFYQPFVEDEVENSTVVHMFFPSETPRGLSSSHCSFLVCSNCIYCMLIKLFDNGAIRTQTSFSWQLQQYPSETL